MEFLEIHEECQEIPVGLEDQLAPKQMMRSGIGLEINIITSKAKTFWFNFRYLSREYLYYYLAVGN